MEMAFSIVVYDERVRRVQQRMARAGLDGLVLTMPDAIHWLTGISSVGYLWPQALLVPLTGEPRYVTRTTEEPGVRALSWLRELQCYDIADQDPIEQIVAGLDAKNLAHGTLGVELEAFTMLPGNWDRIRSLLPEVTWIDASQLVPELRLVKEPDELAYQRQAGAMADIAMLETLDAIRPGMSEVQLAGIAAAALGAAGSEFSAIPPMVVSGDRSALVHALGTRRTFSVGDVVCVEIAGVVNRYHAVLMRTAVIGQPTDRVAQVAECQQQAMEAAVKACSQGTAAHVPDDECNAVLERLDLVGARCHRIGYSLGIAYPPGWLEPMTLVKGDSHTLAPGMSFTIEPNLHLPHEGFGLKLGDTVECTVRGPRSPSQCRTSCTSRRPSDPREPAAKAQKGAQPNRTGPQRSHRTCPRETDVAVVGRPGSTRARGSVGRGHPLRPSHCRRRIHRAVDSCARRPRGAGATNSFGRG